MRIQTNGACERANPLGDTYGPTAYEAYIPGYLITGWSGKWDDLPTAHLTAILWDLLTIVGLAFVGLRFGGARLGAVLAFAWAAYPFTQYVSNSNTNDAIMPCLLVWAFWLVGRPVASGVLAAASGWTKFASLIVAPLWLTYPTGRLNRRFLAGFVAGTLAVFSILLLDPHPLHEIATFWHRTVGYQLGRDAPWSLWDWRQYHARGLPDFHPVQRLLQVMLLIGAIVVAIPAAPEVAAPARRVHGRAAGGVRDGADVLALHVHPVVLPVRARSRLLVPGDGTAAASSTAAQASTRIASIPRALPVVVARDDDALETDAAFRRFETDGQPLTHPRDREV